MKAKTILILVITLGSINFGYNQKETKFFDQNDKEISERKLYRLQKRNNLNLIYGTIETENYIQTKLVPRRVDGTLKKQERLDIISFIEGLTKSSIPKKYTIVILYNTHQEFYKSFEKFSQEELRNTDHYYQISIRESEELIQLNIYETEDDFRKHFKDEEILKSNSHVIENIFFKMRYPSGGYALFNYHGKFVSYFGEFHPSQTMEDIYLIEQSK